MRPAARWLALALAALAGVIVAALLVGPRLGGTSGSPSALPSASAYATADGSSSASASALAGPNCVQTPPPSQAPAPSGGPGIAGLVLRMWPEAPVKFHAVTVLEDGRIITTSYPPGAEGPEQGTSVERRLTTAGIQLFRSELDATGLTFLTSADWLPADLPWDGQPSTLEVGLSGGERSILNWLRLCTNLETEALDALADRLVTVDEWLPADAWADANAKPYAGPL